MMVWRLVLVGVLPSSLFLTITALTTPSLAQHITHDSKTPKGPVEHHSPLVTEESLLSLQDPTPPLPPLGLEEDPLSSSSSSWSYGPRLLRTAQHPLYPSHLPTHANASRPMPQAGQGHERRRGHAEASLSLGLGLGLGGGIMWKDAQLLRSSTPTTHTQTQTQPHTRTTEAKAISSSSSTSSSKEQQQDEAPLPDNLPVGSGTQEVALPNGYSARTGPAEDLGYLFDLSDIVNKTSGPLAWLGADVASSIRLAQDRYLWVFGDTFVGTFHMEETRRYEIIYLPSQSFGFATMDPSGSGRVLDLSLHWASCPPRNLSSPPSSPPSLNGDSPIVSGRPSKHKVDDGRAQSLFLYSASKEKEGEWVKVLCNTSDPNQRLDFLWPLSGLRWPVEPSPTHSTSTLPQDPSAQGGDKARRRHHHPSPSPPLKKEENENEEGEGEPLLLLAVHSSNKSKGGRFVVLGSVAILVANPEDDPMNWRYRVVEFSRQDMKQGGAMSAPVWGASPVVASDGYSYIFGSLRNTHHLNDQVLCRLPTPSLRGLDFSELEAWGRPLLPQHALDKPRGQEGTVAVEKTSNNNTKTQDDTHHSPPNATIDSSKPLLQPLQQQQQQPLQPLGPVPSWFPINGEGWVWEALARDEGVSELSITYHHTLRLWLKVTLPVFTPTILLWTSPSLTGPWSRHVLYTVPAPYNDLDRYKFYAAKMHPELSPQHKRDCELVVSYVIGMGPRALPGDFYLPGPPWLYNPQFLRVSLDKLTPPLVAQEQGP